MFCIQYKDNLEVGSISDSWTKVQFPSFTLYSVFPHMSYGNCITIWFHTAGMKDFFITFKVMPPMCQSEFRLSTHLSQKAACLKGDAGGWEEKRVSLWQEGQFLYKSHLHSDQLLATQYHIEDQPQHDVKYPTKTAMEVSITKWRRNHAVRVVRVKPFKYFIKSCSTQPGNPQKDMVLA